MVSSSTELTTCTYYGDGKRQSIISDTGGTNTTDNHNWDGQNILLDANKCMAELKYYTNTPGMWGSLASQCNIPTNSSAFQAFDPQGSSRELISSTEAVSDTNLYKAFGQVLVSTGSATNEFQYGGLVGYYHDQDFRLYVRARYYDPIKARWLTRDPIGFDGGDWNLYRYVGSEPTTNTDPGGLQRHNYVCGSTTTGSMSPGWLCVSPPNALPGQCHCCMQVGEYGPDQCYGDCQNAFGCPNGGHPPHRPNPPLTCALIRAFGCARLCQVVGPEFYLECLDTCDGIEIMCQLLEHPHPPINSGTPCGTYCQDMTQAAPQRGITGEALYQYCEHCCLCYCPGVTQGNEDAARPCIDYNCTVYV